MVHSFFELKTSPSLLQALERATTRQPTRDELFEQRVSFVYGSVDSKSSVTREQVRHILNHEGASGARK